VHAIRQYDFGPAQNLRYEELPDPVPEPDQVQIAVEASGVHLIDTAIRRGDPAGPYTRPDLPMVPGREVAGVVQSTGTGAGETWLGRRVVAHLGPASGGYAELAVASVASLHEIPDNLTADAAVAMIGTGRTAVGILEAAALTADDVVLVTAAAGGLGTLFVQAALNLGAVVVGLAGGPDKTARVREAGATIAVDYLDPDWPDRVTEALGERQVSVVLDGVGGPTARAAMELLAPGGTLVIFGWSSGEPVRFTTLDLFANSLTVTAAVGPGLARRPGGIRELETRALAEAAAGRLVPSIQRFPLADAATAHTALETRATVGKAVLVP
jgi:NADPH:quinone reductase